MKRLLLTNLLAYGGSAWLITVTAPGADVLPWDGSSRKVVEHDAHEWNRTAPKRWSELHRRAWQETRRALGGGPTALARVWQMQERGVLHVHLALGVDRAEEMAAARYYVAELRARAREHGFGFVDARDRDGKAGRSTVMEPHRVAGYLSRYMASSQLAEAVEVRRSLGRKMRLVWVSPTLTKLTGCTMRRIRRARILWSWRQRRCDPLGWAGRVPTWFRDSEEHRLVASLLAAPAAP